MTPTPIVPAMKPSASEREADDSDLLLNNLRCWMSFANAAQCHRELIASGFRRAHPATSDERASLLSILQEHLQGAAVDIAGAILDAGYHNPRFDSIRNERDSLRQRLDDALTREHALVHDLEETIAEWKAMGDETLAGALAASVIEGDIARSADANAVRAALPPAPDDNDKAREGMAP